MENIGLIDRMIRFVIAIVFIVIGFTVSAWWFIVAAIALITGLIGWCGLYKLFGISTVSKADSAKNLKTVPKKSAKKIKR